ncbi:Golgi mannosyltransferase complex subunit [Rhodotorula toruloides]
MFHSSKRRPPALPTTRFVPSSTQNGSTGATYKDKSLRPPSIRVRIQHLCTRPATLLGLFLLVFVGTGWILGLFGASSERVRMGGGPKVVARDWSGVGGVRVQGGLGGPLVDEKGFVTPAREYNETVLILCPMRNSIEHIWHFFHLVSTLTYPSHLLHLGILVSDTTDGTYQRALELADERQYSRKFRGKRMGRISVFQKDFAADQKAAGEDAYVGENVGKERHAYAAQVGRRKLLGKSRTWLLNAAMAPEVDWVLWVDVDVVDYEASMIERLLAYAKGDRLSLSGRGADVVVPNCVWKTYNELGPYDRNNWIETPESLKLKAELAPNEVLIEGYKDHPTHRFNLASLVPAADSSTVLSPHNPYLLSAPFPLTSLPSWPPADLTLPPALASATTVPETLDLDAVGGCLALVRAEVHREGAVFPAWPPVDHQLETEGFAQLVKALRRPAGREEAYGADALERKNGRGRLIGLPRYYVYHGLYG